MFHGVHTNLSILTAGVLWNHPQTPQIMETLATLPTFISPEVGYGLVARRRIPANTHFNYSGVIVDPASLDKPSTSSYTMLSIIPGTQKGWHQIDAMQGNLTRFINHSTDSANLKPGGICYRGLRVVLVSDEIPEGCQLLYNYRNQFKIDKEVQLTAQFPYYRSE